MNKNRKKLENIGMISEFDNWKEHALEIVNGPLRVGDRVKVMRKSDNDTESWSDGWVEQMDDAIGLFGTIRNISGDRVNINFEVRSDKSNDSQFLRTYNYPIFVLKRVRT